MKRETAEKAARCLKRIETLEENVIDFNEELNDESDIIDIHLNFPKSDKGFVGALKKILNENLDKWKNYLEQL